MSGVRKRHSSFRKLVVSCRRNGFLSEPFSASLALPFLTRNLSGKRCIFIGEPTALAVGPVICCV